MKCPYQHPLLPFSTTRARLAARFITCAATAIMLTPAAPVSADCPAAQWEPFRTPTHEGLLVAPGSDIDRFCIAGDDGSTVYAIGTSNSPCGGSGTVDPYAPDGMLFNPGQSPRLWKSSDGGTTWEDRTKEVLAALNLPDAGAGQYDDFLVFTAVASAPDDADIVLVAGYNRNGSAVSVVSSDGAGEFQWLGCVAPDGVVLCAAVSPDSNGAREIAVGTIDPVNGGRIWRLEVGKYWTSTWIDTSAYDGWAEAESWHDESARILAVTSIAFSGDYFNDNTVAATIIAQATETDGDAYYGYYVALGTWAAAPAWNSHAGFIQYPALIKDAGHVIHAPIHLPLLLLRDLASLALPADFNADAPSQRRLLVAINGSSRNPTTDSVVTEGGFLFWLQSDSFSSDMLLSQGNPWVASVSYLGLSDMRGNILIGTWLPSSWSLADIGDWFNSGVPALACCGGVQVLLSHENDPCCPRWEVATRPPSGQFNAQVAFPSTGDLAFCSTSGDGRLWQNGKWYADESAFSTSGPTPLHWEQTGLIDTMINRIVDISYDPATSALYLRTAHRRESGMTCTCESVWRTISEGEHWSRVLCGRPATDSKDDAAFGDILRKYRRGFFKPVTKGYLSAAGMRYIIGSAIDPDSEEQVEAGLIPQAIYRMAERNGVQWKRMTNLELGYDGLILMDCTDAPGSVLYAGCDSLWWDYSRNCPLPYPGDGTTPSCPAGHDCRLVSGAARLLAPDHPDCCLEYQWDYLIRGLTGSSSPSGIYEQLQLVGANCASGSIRLWAIDRGSCYWGQGGVDGQSYDWCTGKFIDGRWGRLWTYDDCYGITATTTWGADTPLTVPSDPCRCAHEAFTLEWNRACDACEYEIEVAFDLKFNHIALETSTFIVNHTKTRDECFYHPPDPCAPSVLVPAGTLDCNQSYWWRVRAHLAETGEVIASWWSEPRHFYTAPGPAGSLALHSPGDGATAVPITNVAFTWSAVSGATRYDFMLVDQDRGHVASQVWDNTYFILPLDLEYDTPYVWRVIALDGDRVIAESAQASFRTKAEPASAQYVSPGPAIVPPQLERQDNWGWYFAGIVAMLLAAAIGALSWVNRSRKRTRRPFRPRRG